MSVSLIDPRQLKKIRVQLGMTQAQLAKASGISQSLVAKLESGNVDPSFTTMRAISDAMRSQIKSHGRKASEIMSSPVRTVQTHTPVSECINLMKSNAISQMPVLAGTAIAGSVSEAQIVSLLSGANNPKEILSKPVADFAEPSFPIVSPDTPVDALYSLFNFVPAILVATGDKVAGIITKIDMISAEVR